MPNDLGFYINGAWVNPKDRRRIQVLHATTGEPLGDVPAGTEEDIQAATAAARGAFAHWSTTSSVVRAEYLTRIGSELLQRRDEAARLIAAEVGTPLPVADAVQLGLPIANLGVYAAMARDYEYESRLGNSVVLREPVGVVGCIAPWNYPLHQIVAKIAPALGAGCTVVVKPSEMAPLSVGLLTEVIDAAGLPKGVFNLVYGDGEEAGAALVADPQVDMVSFTGSTAVGRKVGAVAGAGIKRVQLELGGKSAMILLPDAPFEVAIRECVASCFLNNGQTCTALSRLLVPASREQEAIALAKAAAESYQPGDPLGGEFPLGPLASERQRRRVVGFIQAGLREGAVLVTGGPDRPEGMPVGFFVRPTVFAGVTNAMTIAREEIFGPVLCILAYKDEDEAVRIANDSPYGLAGAVWSGDQGRAQALARQLRTGAVDVNGGRFNLVAPFGGYKQSGIGRELGQYGFEEFLEYKTIQL